MTEPLNEKPKLDMQELFTKDAVEKFRTRPGEIKNGNLRHYNQLITRFDDSEILVTLSRFQIPTNARITIFGGFTGQFAESLRRIGMKVIFTDPLDEWVEHARKLGFESFKASAQEISKELIERTDLIASFECYPDLIGSSEFYYPFMRFLTVEHGILFAESESTVASMRENSGDVQELGTFRRWLRPLYRVYGIVRKARKTEHLNIYHIFAKPDIRQTLLVDCRVMKVVHDTFQFDHRVRKDDYSTIASEASLDQFSVESSLNRLRKLSESINAPYIKVMPFLEGKLRGSMRIGSKRFFIVAE